MPNSANNRIGAVPNWALFSDPNFDRNNISGLVLKVLCRLEAVHPERVDLSDCDNVKNQVVEFTKIWNWLEGQGIVSGSATNCSLTLPGVKAFRTGVGQADDSIRASLHTEKGPSGTEATKLMLDILRQHYHDYIKRIEEN